MKKVINGHLCNTETLAIIDKYREERNLTYDQAIKKLITK